MAHIKWLDIESFRGIENLQLDDARQINILVGENNTGKTSILEAISLWEYPLEIYNFIKVARNREIIISPSLHSYSLMAYDSFLNLFNKNQHEDMGLSLKTQIDGEKLKLTVTGFEGKGIVNYDRFDRSGSLIIKKEKIEDVEMSFFEGVLKLVLLDSNHEMEKEFIFYEFDSNYRYVFKDSLRKLLVRSITPIDYHMSSGSAKSIEEVIKAGDKGKIIDLLQIFDPEIKGFEMLSANNKILPYIEHKRTGLLPISVYGNGLRKAMTIAASIIGVKNGVILIDEIETGIHASALKTFFSWFTKACKEYNVQVFATTHSLEAIDAIIEGCREDLDDVVVYRLERYEGGLYSRRFNGQKLWGIRNDLGQDVR